MRETGDEVVRRVRDRLNHGLKIIRIEDGLLFEHRNATYFVAEVDLRGQKVTVPLAEEFQDHPDYDGDELIEHAMETLRPQLDSYRERGYRVRETEWSPSSDGGSYDDRQYPVFVAFLERKLEDWEELYVELEWLLDRLPEK